MAYEGFKIKQKFVVCAGKNTFPSSHDTTTLLVEHFIEEHRKKTG